MMRRLPSGRFSAIALPTSLLLLGAIFRLTGLARDQRFHPDEAMYADLSRRVGIWGDWQLLNIPTDKPPLFQFVGGLFFRVMGDSEFTTRLPNAVASLITLALLFTLTRRLSGSKSAATIAVLMVIFSPLDIALAISGFVDSQLILWLILSMLMLTYQRWGASGWAAGAALAIKQTAVWVFPLILGLGLLLDPEFSWRKVWQWGRSILITLVLITVWDISGYPLVLWQQSGTDYLHNAFNSPNEILPRIQDWGEFTAFLFPHPILFAFSGILIGFYLLIPQFWVRIKTGAYADAPLPAQGRGGSVYPPYFQSRLVLLLIAFVLGYSALHWFIIFHVYDRYLILILPALAIATGISLQNLSTRLLFATRVFNPLLLVGIFLVIIGIVPAWQAGQGKTEIASDLGKHEGIDKLAEVMNRDYAGEIFYEHWIGWELRYYLTADPQVIVVWFPDPEGLVAFARREFETMDVPRYFVTPIGEAARWIETIERLGLKTAKVYDDGRYVIFSLTD